MKVRFTRGALAQLAAIRSDLTAKNPAAAQAFETRIRQVSMRISQFPHSFQAVAQRPGVRRAPLLRYPFLVFYKVVAEEAIIVRIIHGARREPWENL